MQRKLFPPAEERIQRTLREAAATASFGAEAGNLARMAAINRLTGYCTADVEIRVDLPGVGGGHLVGRDQLREVAMGMHAGVRSLHIRLRHVFVDLEQDRATAGVHVIAEVRVDGNGDPWVGEFKLVMVNLEGAWLVRRIDPVRTLRL